MGTERVQIEHNENERRLGNEGEFPIHKDWLYILWLSLSRFIKLENLFGKCFPCAIISIQCRQNHIGKWRKNLNKCHFPYFRAQSGKDYFILSVSINVESERIGALFFLFWNDFFPLWSVMIAFIRMKKCKIKFYWDSRCS